MGKRLGAGPLAHLGVPSRPASLSVVRSFFSADGAIFLVCHVVSVIAAMLLGRRSAAGLVGLVGAVGRGRGQGQGLTRTAPRRALTTPRAAPPPSPIRQTHAHAHGHAHGHAPVPWYRWVLRPFQLAGARYLHALHTYPVTTKSVTSGCMYCLGDVLAQVVAPAPTTPATATTDAVPVPVPEPVPVPVPAPAPAPGGFTLDVQRAAIFFVYGLVVAGPIYHVWFSRLDRLPFLLMKTRHFERMVRFRRLQRNAKALGVTLPPGAKPKKPAELSKVAKVASKVLVDQAVFSPLYLLVFFYTTGVMRGDPLDACTAHVRAVFWPSLLADCALWPVAQVINFAMVPVPLQPIYVNVLNVFWNAFLSYMAHSDH
jgi:putative intracellular protease/amidase